MKLTIIATGLILSFLMGFSFCIDNTDIQSLPQHSYELLLVVLDQDSLKIERHPIYTEYKTKQVVFYLDLSDRHRPSNKISCNNKTDGRIVIGSNNTVLSDYILNWKAMVGIDIVSSQVAAFVPAVIKTNEQGMHSLTVSGQLENRDFCLEVEVAQSVKDACALVVTTELAEKMSTREKIMSYATGCELGIIILRSIDPYLNQTNEQEIEFERIINSMVQDGTIRVKPVSPFMAQLRTLGSTIFVKYLTAKKTVRSWWKSLWISHNQGISPTEQTTPVR